MALDYAAVAEAMGDQGEDLRFRKSVVVAVAVAVAEVHDCLAAVVTEEAYSAAGLAVAALPGGLEYSPKVRIYYYVVEVEASYRHAVAGNLGRMDALVRLLDHV